ncbi:hypothetical protein BX600DRAFT_440158 [Xylariales sp. PMI_506]|nr:hypothetical protein BX600DRAFT_440158 [Xylariales sp. PMI_506]
MNAKLGILNLSFDTFVCFIDLLSSTEINALRGTCRELKTIVDQVLSILCDKTRPLHRNTDNFPVLELDRRRLEEYAQEVAESAKKIVESAEEIFVSAEEIFVIQDFPRFRHAFFMFDPDGKDFNDLIASTILHLRKQSDIGHRWNFMAYICLTSQGRYDEADVYYQALYPRDEELDNEMFLFSCCCKHTNLILPDPLSPRILKSGMACAGRCGDFDKLEMLVELGGVWGDAIPEIAKIGHVHILPSIPGLNCRNLYSCSTSIHPKTVDYLLESGVRVGKLDDSPALISALKAGDIEVFRVILRRQPDWFQPVADGQLMISNLPSDLSYETYSIFIKFLVQEAKLDLTAADTNGRGALDVAVNSFNPNFVKAILNMEPDLSLRDNTRKNATELAIFILKASLHDEGLFQSHKLEPIANAVEILRLLYMRSRQ